MTDPNGRILRAGFEARAPRTAAEFVAYYDRSPVAQANREDIRAYKSEFVGNQHRLSLYKDSHKAEHAKTAHPKSAYITSIPMQARALITRRVQILRGGIAIQIVTIVCVVFSSADAAVAHVSAARSSSRPSSSAPSSCVSPTRPRPSSPAAVSFSCAYSALLWK